MDGGTEGNEPPNPIHEKRNPLEEPPLRERDFIAEPKRSPSRLPFWLVLFLATALFALMWGSKGFHERLLQNERAHDPFLEVTYRDFSLFLWQFPSFLKLHRGQKTGYLPGFLPSSENLDLEAADTFVSAPPDLLFLYHTWNRLLAPEVIVRPIAPEEFDRFLRQLPEWQPQHWPEAPPGYIEWIRSRNDTPLEDFQSLPEAQLPSKVRKAFLGWKNYFLEGAQINALSATVGEVRDFLTHYPAYARPLWRNIGQVDGQPVAGLDYLQDLLDDTIGRETPIPREQLPPFLRVALFNARQFSKRQNPPHTSALFSRWGASPQSIRDRP